MKKPLILLIVLAAAAAAVYWGRDYWNPRQEKGLLLSGNVEITEMRLGFKTAGRVIELAADEGDAVRQGRRLAALESAELESVVAQNRGIVKEAQDRLDELKAGSRTQEIEQAKAALNMAEAELSKVKKDYDRADILFKNGAISASQFDTAKSAWLSGAAKQREAFEKLSLTKEGARREQISASEARLLQARATLATAEERLRDAVLYAPVSGMILRKEAELGETVAAGVPVFLLGDLGAPWVKVYVKEDRMGMVKLGQKVQITTDTYPGRIYEGTVTFISSEAEFTPKNVQTREERVKLVFGVKVSAQNPNQELKPGMPADVRILEP